MCVCVCVCTQKEQSCRCSGVESNTLMLTLTPPQRQIHRKAEKSNGGRENEGAARPCVGAAPAWVCVNRSTPGPFFGIPLPCFGNYVKFWAGRNSCSTGASDRDTRPPGSRPRAAAIHHLKDDHVRRQEGSPKRSQLEKR